MSEKVVDSGKMSSVELKQPSPISFNTNQYPKRLCRILLKLSHILRQEWNAIKTVGLVPTLSKSDTEDFWWTKLHTEKTYSSYRGTTYRLYLKPSEFTFNAIRSETSVNLINEYFRKCNLVQTQSTSAITETINGSVDETIHHGIKCAGCGFRLMIEKSGSCLNPIILALIESDVRNILLESVKSRDPSNPVDWTAAASSIAAMVVDDDKEEALEEFEYAILYVLRLARFYTNGDEKVEDRKTYACEKLILSLANNDQDPTDEEADIIMCCHRDMGFSQDQSSSSSSLSEDDEKSEQ